MLAKLITISILLFSTIVLADTVKPADKQNLRIAMLAAEAQFDSNTVALTPAGVQSLQDLIVKLAKFPEVLSIRIVGHTDDIGSIEFNKSLSLQRANFIKQNFSEKFAKAHLIAIGMGEAQPIAKNDNEAGRERNRRVEIQVIAKGYMPISNDSATTNN